jgi:hypothetical protein
VSAVASRDDGRRRHTTRAEPDDVRRNPSILAKFRSGPSVAECGAMRLLTLSVGSTVAPIEQVYVPQLAEVCDLDRALGVAVESRCHRTRLASNDAPRDGFRWLATLTLPWAGCEESTVLLAFPVLTAASR